MSEPTTDAVAAPVPALMSYADFGQRFFEAAVTRERVVAAAAGLAGRPIEVGPLGVGPLGVVKVRANGEVGAPIVEPREGEHVAFEVTVPVDLHLVIEVGLDKYRFMAGVGIRLAVTARAAEPLLILIDIEAPTKKSIDVDLHADGMRASVVRLVAGVDNEIRKAVATFVRREIEKPEMQKARRIDVEKALQQLSH
ncbi:MAG: hypothetical protein ABI345_14115 [Jatrophihabitans sp.]